MDEKNIYQSLENKKVYLFFKRLFDIVVSLMVLTILAIPFLLVSLGILVHSGLPIYYKQKRVGKDKKIFNIIKYRTMVVGSDINGDNLTLKNDMRVTKIGKVLRKFKIDEFPQFYNVLIGNMSIVGPRPETPKLVDLYGKYPDVIFAIRPGITDYASIEFSDESKYYSDYSQSEKIYLEKILPEKILYQLDYVKKVSLITDIKIIFKTAKKIFLKNKE